MKIEIIKLGKSNIANVFKILKQLRTSLDIPRLSSFINHEQYKIELVLFEGKPVGVIGYRILETITRGVHCHIHDLVIDQELRTKGYGKAIINFYANRFKKNCSWIFLDAAETALGFYDNIGFLRHTATLAKLKLK